MAGHSQFANIKHRKEREDAKRGKTFTKFAKEITIAVRLGGKDPIFNPRLRLAIEKAKAANTPKDNIDRAIKRGSGELDEGILSEVRYEGYGPGGVAVIIDALTNNKNRTASEVRHAFNKFGGSLGETGTVSWNFDRKGIILIDKTEAKEEEAMNLSIEAGAEDFVVTEDSYIIVTEPEKLYEADEKIKLKKESHISMLPQNFVELDEEKRETFLKMVDHLRHLEDVQEVYHNLSDGI